MEMPVITRCTAETCAYNQEQHCHALAITIGEPREARCETFVEGAFTGGDPEAVGHVGACRMSDCQHNTNLECQAPNIVVGYQQNTVDCLTYQPQPA
ncbi:MAG TPA: DUF1540 domain-containing protein [Actinopolymorphaceae bacterium]|jgi:hypothetical protein